MNRRLFAFALLAGALALPPVQELAAPKPSARSLSSRKTQAPRTWQTPAHLHAAPVSFSIAPLATYTHGDVHEYVFSRSTSADGKSLYNNMMSRLDWDMRNLFAAGAELGVEWALPSKKTLSLQAQFLMGFPSASGVMQDYDWIDGNGFYNGIWTHYSRHNNSLASDMDFSLLAAFINPRGWGFSLGATVQDTLFSATGGYRQYVSAPNTVDPATTPKKEFTGTDGDTTYHYTTVFLRTGVTYRHIPRQRGLGVSLGLWVLPLQLSMGLDHHVSRKTWFYDSMAGVFSGCVASAEVSVHCTRALSVFVGGEGTLFRIIKGKDYYWSDSTGPEYAVLDPGARGGSNMERLSLRAGLRFRR